MAINRTPFNALVDDDGSNTVGSVWNKSAISTVILDPADVAYAPFASPAFTGVPTAPTAAPGANTTQLATTAFVTAAAAPPAWVPVTYSAANFVGTGTMTWTVDSADQVRYSYLLNGKTLTVSVYLDSTTLGGTATTEVRLTIPGGYTCKGWSTGYCWIVIGALGISGTVRGVASQSYLSLFKADLTNFSLGTNNVTFGSTFTFEIN